MAKPKHPVGSRVRIKIGGVRGEYVAEVLQYNPHPRVKVLHDPLWAGCELHTGQMKILGEAIEMEARA